MRPLRQLLTLGYHVHASHNHTLSQVDGFSNRRKGVTYLEKLDIYIPVWSTIFTLLFFGKRHFKTLYLKIYNNLRANTSQTLRTLIYFRAAMFHKMNMNSQSHDWLCISPQLHCASH